MEIEDWIEKNKVSPAIAESQGLLFVVDPAIIDPTLIDIERDKAWGEGHKEAKRESEDELTDLDHKIDRYEKAIQKHKEEKGHNEGFSDAFDEELYKSIK